MKLPRLLSSTFVALLLAALGGCAAGSHGHMSHHAATGNHHATGTGDMAEMCEMHRKEMAGKTAAEQEALVREHMKGMSPEMRQRMEAMHARCK